MKEKGLILKMLALICFTLLLCNIAMAQTQFSVTTTLPADNGSMPRVDDTAHVLSCEIQATNITVNATYTYIWTKNDMLVAVGEQIQQDFKDRFLIQLTSSESGPDVYQLSISTIAVMDSGLYTCLVADGSLDNTTSLETIRNSTLASSNETISVRYFPSQDPICSTDITGPIESGMGITLSCVSNSPGNPEVDLQWSGFEQQAVTRTGDMVTLDQVAYVTSKENGTSFTCSMTSSESYPEEKRNCTVEPIVVLPGPSYVTITIRTAAIVLGKDAEFACSLSSRGSMISWFTDPPTDSSRGITSALGNDIYTILNVTSNDIGKRVFCEGTRDSDGQVFREYIELLPTTTTEPVPTTKSTLTTKTSATTTGSAAILTTSTRPPSQTPTDAPSQSVTTLAAPVKPEGLDIVLIAVVSAASGFVLLVVLIVVIACCCCCRRGADPNDTKSPVGYDWEGHPPSHARTAPVQSPSPVPDRGPDPIVVRNPTHSVPQTELLTNPLDNIAHTGMSPSLAFAMRNLVDEDDVSDDDSQQESDRLKIPRAVARDPPQTRRKSKDQMVDSGSFVSRGHPLKRTPLNIYSLESDSAGDPLYSSAERQYTGINRDPTYASAERTSALPPDVTVTRDPSVTYAKVDRNSADLHMPDVTVGLADASPIVNFDGSSASPSPSPNNTAVPRKKLPAGARAAIGPVNGPKRFSLQPDLKTTRLSAEISNQDIVPIMTDKRPQEAPNTAPPTYEDVSRLKAQGKINSGFQHHVQFGPTDTMIIHNDATDGSEQKTSNQAANSETKDIQYF